MVNIIIKEVIEVRILEKLIILWIYDVLDVCNFIF